MFSLQSLVKSQICMYVYNENVAICSVIYSKVILCMKESAVIICLNVDRIGTDNSCAMLQ